MGFKADVEAKLWGDVLRRFWSRVVKDEISGCWLWIGASNAAGYGSIEVYSIRIYVHRFSYEIHKGDIAPGYIVMHTCDTVNCVNPEHLVAATQQANMTDKMAKGRHRWLLPNVRGAANPAARITEDTAVRIRAEYTPEEGYRKLGQRYGLSKSQTYRIVTGLAWR